MCILSNGNIMDIKRFQESLSYDTVFSVMDHYRCQYMNIAYMEIFLFICCGP